jgi:hypothetical protein
MVCEKECTLSDFCWWEQGFMRGVAKAAGPRFEKPTLKIENDHLIFVRVHLDQEHCRVLMY